MSNVAFVHHVVRHKTKLPLLFKAKVNSGMREIRMTITKDMMGVTGEDGLVMPMPALHSIADYTRALYAQQRAHDKQAGHANPSRADRVSPSQRMQPRYVQNATNEMHNYHHIEIDNNQQQPQQSNSSEPQNGKASIVLLYLILGLVGTVVMYAIVKYILIPILTLI